MKKILMYYVLKSIVFKFPSFLFFINKLKKEKKNGGGRGGGRGKSLVQRKNFAAIFARYVLSSIVFTSSKFFIESFFRSHFHNIPMQI